MCGSATFTTVASRNAMLEPSTHVTSTRRAAAVPQRTPTSTAGAYDAARVRPAPTPVRCAGGWHEPTRAGGIALPATARRQPGRLVAVVRRRVRRGTTARRPRPAERRLQRVPLVPRDGARVVRGRRHRRADERALRVHQGRPRGAT